MSPFGPQPPLAGLGHKWPRVHRYRYRHSRALVAGASHPKCSALLHGSRDRHPTPGVGLARLAVRARHATLPGDHCSCPYLGPREDIYRRCRFLGGLRQHCEVGLTVRALSQSTYALELMQGPVTSGISLGHGHLLFGRDVLSLTRPGDLRMPNGLECDLPELEPGAQVQVGGGRLECGAGSVQPGTVWDPRPRPRFAVSTSPGLASWDLVSIAGAGPGLTPLGDDIAVGHLGACALLGIEHVELLALATRLAARTTSLSGVLLRLAAQGHLPEATHRLLGNGNPQPLLSWGATSGSGILTGLGLHGAAIGMDVVQTLDIPLPLTPPRRVRVDLGTISEDTPNPHYAEAGCARPHRPGEARRQTGHD